MPNQITTWADAAAFAERIEAVLPGCRSVDICHRTDGLYEWSLDAHGCTPDHADAVMALLGDGWTFKAQWFAAGEVAAFTSHDWTRNGVAVCLYVRTALEAAA